MLPRRPLREWSDALRDVQLFNYIGDASIPKEAVMPAVTVENPLTLPRVTAPADAAAASRRWP